MDKPNISYIEQLSGDDETFKKEFINILVTEFPQEKKTYEKAISDINYEDAVQIVHKLKHKFNILSMSQAYTLAVDYEEELKLKNMEKDPEFNEILIIIEGYLKTIS
ncbi:Hpt domain-containing protein [Maribacter sp. CXY002]|uniref:Hpt domain-containing protein n=1 Tax=Maribacter luteocoastalis TaxID=3407671 RepID=UPI003B66C813